MREREGLKSSLSRAFDVRSRRDGGACFSFWGAREEGVCDVYVASQEDVEQTRTWAWESGVLGEIGARNKNLWFKHSEKVFEVLKRNETTQG